MIPIVEDYLTELMQQKLDFLRKNPQHLNKILGTSQVRITRLAAFLKDNPIRIVKGYPRTPAELPSISILLQGEEETQEGLGNQGDTSDMHIKSFTEELEVYTDLSGGTPILYIDMTYKPVIGVSQIVHNEFSMILTEDDYSLVDSSSGRVVIMSGNVEPGDTVTASYTFKEVTEDSLSVLYDANYRLEVWALNGDLTVELYHIVKWMLLSGRDYLADEKDLFNQRLGGADFQPAPSYFPEFVYRRAVTFWCQFTASTPTEEELAPYITGVEVGQTQLGTYGGDE